MKKLLLIGACLIAFNLPANAKCYHTDDNRSWLCGQNKVVKKQAKRKKFTRARYIKRVRVKQRTAARVKPLLGAAQRSGLNRLPAKPLRASERPSVKLQVSDVALGAMYSERIDDNFLAQFGEALVSVVTAPVQILHTIFTYIFSVGRCQGLEEIDWRVRRVVDDAARHFGRPAQAISCYRPLAYNRAIYGNRKLRNGRYRGDGSQHIRKRAIDFRIPGVAKHALAKYLRRHPLMRSTGGIGLYCGDFVHVDSRPTKVQVNWNWCRRASRRR